MPESDQDLKAPGDVPPPSGAIDEADLEAMPEVGIPRWVTMAGVAVALLALYSATRLPRVIRASIAEERGKRFALAGDYGKAATEFEHVHAAYPEMIRPTLELAEAYMAGGKAVEAAHTVETLQGRMLSKDETARADRLVDELNKHFGNGMAQPGNGDHPTGPP